MGNSIGEIWSVPHKDLMAQRKYYNTVRGYFGSHISDKLASSQTTAKSRPKIRQYWLVSTHWLANLQVTQNTLSGKLDTLFRHCPNCYQQYAQSMPTSSIIKLLLFCLTRSYLVCSAHDEFGLRWLLFGTQLFAKTSWKQSHHPHPHISKIKQRKGE